MRTLPKELKIGSRTVAWRYGDIWELAERLFRGGHEAQEKAL